MFTALTYRNGVWTEIIEHFYKEIEKGRTLFSATEIQFSLLDASLVAFKNI